MQKGVLNNMTIKSGGKILWHSCSEYACMNGTAVTCKAIESEWNEYFIFLIRGVLFLD